MKTLALFPRQLWETKLSPARRHAIAAVHRHPGVELKLSGQGWPDWDNDRSARQNARAIMPGARVVWWYKWQGHRQIPAIRNPDALSRSRLTVEAFNEAWWPDGLAAKQAAEAGTGLVICHHANDAPRFSGRRVVHSPHCAELTVFAAAAQADRDIDVLLTGSLNARHYPLRCRLARLIRDGTIPGTIYPHPGTRTHGVAEADRRVQEYADRLGRARIALACSSKWRYALAKYAEAMACGCVVVGDLPDDEWFCQTLGRHIVTIDIEDSDQAIGDTLRDLLADPVRLQQLAEAGREEYRRSYTQDQYAGRFVAVCRSALS